MKFSLLSLIVVVLWFVFGDPPKNIANWFWKNDAAPWEQVDAVYYPNRNDLTVHRELIDVGSTGGCRVWVFSMAAANDDPDLVRGDYECGVGPLGSLGSIRIYRLTIR